jgi:predicted dehydrogenase
MKFLVVGLGSMGKRRIRNLIALGYSDVAGFDPRCDRRNEASSRYSIKVFDSYEAAISNFNPEVLIISTDPALHMEYAFQAVDRNLHCFIEASVVEGDRIKALADSLSGTDLVVVPSCTMRYYPGPINVRQLIRSGKIGRPLNINYVTGQYLPDWHPWEKIEDFYVSRRETGGAREIVPFELTWLNEIFGEPEPLACIKAKVSEFKADIDDIYHCILKYPGSVLLNLTIDVVSRPKALRELHVVGTLGRLVFSGDDNSVRCIAVGDDQWGRIDLSGGTVEEGYINPEEPYISEMKDFIDAVNQRDRKVFPNTLEKDASILALLNELERLDKTK